ncbi:MAG: Ig-like domain-containing protein [Mycobacteriaceae bacterium]
MRASAAVGRVGGLAVAMGIGAAVTMGCAGAAWADSTDSSPVTSAGPAGHRAPASSRSQKPAPAAARTRSQQAGGSVSVPVTSSAAATRVASGVDSARPIARRQAARTIGANASAVSTASTARATAAATNVNPFAAFFFNQTPSVSWAADPVQGDNGVVTGMLDATDAEGDPLSFTVTTAPSNGSVAVGADGSYTYTTSESFAYDGTTDSFTVTASDAGGGFHLHGLAGLLNLLTFGLLGLSGHTATVTVPVSVVAWRRSNSAPTATVTVGEPDPTTGVVLGQVVGSDPDGDVVSYSAPETTAKGSVVIDTGTGEFTFTPNPGLTASTDTFIVTVADGYGGSTPVDVTVPVAAGVVGNSRVRYVFNYVSGASYWTADAISALQYAADRLASYIVVSQPVTLTFDVTAVNEPDSGTLASTGSDLSGSGAGFSYTVVQDKLLQGLDSNGSQADGAIDVNFGIPWDYSDTVASDQYDFVSTMMHELMHAYGFLSYIDEAGYNDGDQWPVFDSVVSDQNGTLVINDRYRFKAVFNPNLTGGNGGLYFSGDNAVAAYGGLVPIFTPDPWESGSSGSHLDDYTFFGPNATLMNAYGDTGPSIRVLSPVEQGILQDIGYTVTTPSWSSVMFMGLIFLRRRRVQ